MTKTTSAMILTLIGTALLGAPRAALAEAAAPRGNQEFIGIDLDNGGVYYNGRNSGRYCLYRTIDVFNRATGYVEARRVRSCGRGLYLP